MMIGVFDSGLGGLSVLEQLLRARALNSERFAYYADTKHVPYGSRSTDEIRELCVRAVKFLQDLGAKAVVVACNTATSAAISHLRQSFSLPIIGMEPAIRQPLSEGLRTLLLATPVTISGDKLAGLIAKTGGETLVQKLALGELVSFAERGDFSSPDLASYLASAIAPYKSQNPQAIVLGCTHFNYFKDSLSTILPDIKFYDGNTGTIRRLLSVLGINDDSFTSQPQLNLDRIEFFYSSQKVKDEAELERLSGFLARLNAMSSI